MIKDAKVQAGLLPLWRRGDKVWLELRPEMLGKPLFLSPKLATGIGEAGVFGGLMQSRFAQVGRPQWVEFRRINQQIQMLAINASFVANTGSPAARSVKAAYSPSLLSAVPLASAPHPGTGGLLVDAQALLMGDWLGLAQHLQRTYRQSYAMDPRNSLLQTARTSPKTAVFELLQHFGTNGIAAPGPAAPGTPPSTVPLNQPDPRSLFVTLHLTLSPLPEQPMARREADARVGYFTSTVNDFTQDLPRTPRQRFINRWRLSKQDPQVKLSPPVQPIVFWLDPSIPEAYRETVTAGVLEWNKAFEAIGYQRAIEVRPAPADGSVDTLETGHASIRWMTNSQPSFGAIGPSHVDPRTGEILDAHIGLESLSSRAIRTTRAQLVNQATALDDDHCAHGELGFDQLTLGLEALGVGLDPDSPEVQRFVLAYLKDTTMHEVGHVLGLRHNFRASRWRTPTQLLDAQLTASSGNSASVMDYSAINLPPPGQAGGSPFQATLGPYDFWAIAYGYGDLPGDAAQARAQLKAVADRAADPKEADALAFGTDEDAALGLDPEVQAFDLGRDPLAFAQTRLAIVRELIGKQALAAATPGPEHDASLARRRVSYGLRELARTSQIVLRQVGGVVARRAPAQAGGDALSPVPATEQRAALELLLTEFLNPEALSLPAALQRRLAPDYLDRVDNGSGQFAGVDFSWQEQLLALQRPLLDVLTSEALAERLLDNADKVRDVEREPLTLKALNKRVFGAIWLTPPQQDASMPAWRSLQREHVIRLAQGVVRGSSGRADVRALARAQAQRVLAHLKALHSGGPDSTAEAHRLDAIQTLSTALQANVSRQSP